MPAPMTISASRLPKLPDDGAVQARVPPGGEHEARVPPRAASEPALRGTPRHVGSTTREEAAGEAVECEQRGYLEKDDTAPRAEAERLLRSARFDGGAEHAVEAGHTERRQREHPQQYAVWLDATQLRQALDERSCPRSTQRRKYRWLTPARARSGFDGGPPDRQTTGRAVPRSRLLTGRQTRWFRVRSQGIPAARDTHRCSPPRSSWSLPARTP